MTQPRNLNLRNFPLGFFYIDSAEVFLDVRRRNKTILENSGNRLLYII